MKSKKLLFGLIVAAFVGGAGFASAQPKANYQNNLIEIGPDNIAGRIRSIVVDNADPSHTTLYAGGVAGGLFKMTNHSSWQYVPCTINGRQVSLPISCMIQLPNNNILIGTGEGIVDNHGINNDRMSPKGRGLYVYNPQEGSFTLVNVTNPTFHPEWSYINSLAALERDGYLFVYAATDEGLYRWKLNANAPDWTTATSLVQAGKFQNVIIVSNDNIAYATTPNQVYRIGNVTQQSGAVDITASNNAFANATRIELAAASAQGTTRLYAVVSDTAGLLDGIYLTTDNTVFSALSSLVQVFGEAKKPIFSADVTGAQAGGILMASGFNYYKAGRATGELCVQILRGAAPDTIPVRFMTEPSDSDLLLDLDVARACGITLSDELVAQANMIFEGGKLTTK